MLACLFVLSREEREERGRRGGWRKKETGEGKGKKKTEGKKEKGMAKKEREEKGEGAPRILLLEAYSSEASPPKVA